MEPFHVEDWEMPDFISTSRKFRQSTERDWELTMRQRTSIDGQPNEFHETQTTVRWDAKSTAVVIVDMWDDIHCKSAARRVAEMAPHMNQVVQAARNKGMLIIHAPSDCSDFYKDTPQRRRAHNAPFVKASVEFQWNPFNPKQEGPLDARLQEPGGCSCDTVEPCGPRYRTWTRQIATITIGEADAISDDGQEIHNLLETRRFDNLIIVGVHTNLCVLGRSFGIRQMVYAGRNVVLCRDLTDSYHRDPGRHFAGLEQIIQHVEKFWCPTITSTSITGRPPFHFKAAKNR